MRKPVQTEPAMRVFKQVLVSKMASPDTGQGRYAATLLSPARPHKAKSPARKPSK